MTQTFFQAIQINPFLQMALLACFLASIASGIMGSYVVIKKISSLSGSIAHSVLGGMGFFLWLQHHYGFLWAHPLYGAFLAAFAAALLIGWSHIRHHQKEDAIIASIWSLGMAIGIIFISLIPGYSGTLNNFLFGNILWVSQEDLYLLIALDLVILFFTYFYYQRFLAICFDEEAAFLQKIPVQSLYLLLLTLISFSIVILIDIIGIILAMALLTIPPTLARLFSHQIPRLMGLSILFSIFFNLMGIYLAFYLNWPPGATIALSSAAFYLLCLKVTRKFQRKISFR